MKMLLRNFIKKKKFFNEFATFFEESFEYKKVQIEIKENIINE